MHVRNIHIRKELLPSKLCAFTWIHFASANILCHHIINFIVYSQQLSWTRCLCELYQLLLAILILRNESSIKIWWESGENCFWLEKEKGFLYWSRISHRLLIVQCALINISKESSATSDRWSILKSHEKLPSEFQIGKRRMEFSYRFLFWMHSSIVLMFITKIYESSKRAFFLENTIFQSIGTLDICWKYFYNIVKLTKE